VLRREVRALHMLYYWAISHSITIFHSIWNRKVFRSRGLCCHEWINVTIQWASGGESPLLLPLFHHVRTWHSSIQKGAVQRNEPKLPVPWSCTSQPSELWEVKFLFFINVPVSSILT
jgi:hypothetical protein